MSHLVQLPKIANELDSMGLHREADVLDAVIEKTAGALSYKEKPFLSRLAKIMLVLEKTEPGSVVQRTDLMFPLSKTPLMGLSRQKGLEKVRAELDAFIEWLGSNLQHRYRGTEYENSYRDFIEAVSNLSRMISSIFISSTEKQSIAEATKAINKTRQMLGRLIVYARTDNAREGVFEEVAEKLLVLERAIQEHDKAVVEQTLKDIQQSIPKKVDKNSDLYRALVEAYWKGDIPFVGVQNLDKEVREDPEEYDLAPETILERQDIAHYEKDRKDRKETAGKLVERIYHLERRWQELKRNITTAGTKMEEQLEQTPIGEMTEPAREYLGKPKPPLWNLALRDWGRYRNVFRKYEFLLNDVDLLAQAYEMWANSDWGTTYDFATFLSAGKPGGRELLHKFMTSIDDQLGFIYRESRWKYEKLEKEEQAAQEKRKEKDLEYEEATNQALWNLWHREFITKLVQMIRYALAPETRGETSTQQAFDRTLKEFHRLLNYRL